MKKKEITSSSTSLKLKAFLSMTFAFICILAIFFIGTYIHVQDDAHLLMFVLIGTSLICIVIIAVLLYFLIHSIIIPINRVSKAMKNMAEGDFSQSLPVTGNTEIGIMEKSFNLLSQKMLSIHQLIEKINSGESFEHTFQYVFDTFEQFIPYNRIGMAVIDEKDGTIRAEIARSREKDIYLRNGYSLPLVYTSLGKVLESGYPRIINDLEEYLKEHSDSESTRLIVQEGMRSNLTMPLKVSDKVIGVLFFSSIRKNAYDSSHIVFLKHIANHLSVSFEKSILVSDLVLASITAIVKLAESRDNDTGKHIDRMRNYSVIIARKIAQNPQYSNIITEKFIRDLYNFSPLHDIGKVGIEDRILLKPGKLTREEFEVMKTHAFIGAEVLKKAQESLKNKDFFAVGVDIALYHHEKYDGSGYPHGLKGNDIPLAARIVAVADVFDALTSKRPYKDPFSVEQSMKIIYDEKGKSFDGDIVDAFFECKNELIKIHKKLSDNYEDIKKTS